MKYTPLFTPPDEFLQRVGDGETFGHHVRMHDGSPGRLGKKDDDEWDPVSLRYITCPYRGPVLTTVTGQQAGCGCGGSVFEVYQCLHPEHHNEPVLKQADARCLEKILAKAPGYTGRTCRECPVPRGEQSHAMNPLPITLRNLIYHVYPDKRNDCWKWNLDQIKRRWSIFNGRRVLAVATDDSTCSLDEVCSYLGDLVTQCDILSLKNNSHLREVASFRHLLKSVRSMNPQEATFYAHTKGNTTAKPGDAVTVWTQGMYRHLLDQIEIVRDLLRTYLFVGANKMVWQDNPRLNPFPTRYVPTGRRKEDGWMLSGTFFWFSHRVYARENALRIDPDRYAAEGWPWAVAEEHEAVSLLQPWPVDWYEGKHRTPASGMKIPSPYDRSTYQSIPLLPDAMGIQEKIPVLVPIQPLQKKGRTR